VEGHEREKNPGKGVLWGEKKLQKNENRFGNRRDSGWKDWKNTAKLILDEKTGFPGIKWKHWGKRKKANGRRCDPIKGGGSEHGENHGTIMKTSVLKGMGKPSAKIGKGRKETKEKPKEGGNAFLLRGKNSSKRKNTKEELSQKIETKQTLLPQGSLVLNRSKSKGWVFPKGEYTVSAAQQGKFAPKGGGLWGNEL